MFDIIKNLFSNSKSASSTNIDIEEQHRTEMMNMRYLVALLVIVIGFLGVSIQSVSSNNVTQIELPPKIYADGKIKVGNGWANDVMFKVWSDWMVNTTADFTPGDIKDKMNEAIRFFDQEKVATYAGQLGALTNMIIQHNIKQTFVINDTKQEYFKDTEFVDIASGDDEIVASKLTYTGTASQSIGSKILPDRKCQYTITIKMEGAHLYGYSYNTNCFN